jgi:membrane fusion protein (multidrug efflux system)
MNNLSQIILILFVISGLLSCNRKTEKAVRERPSAVNVDAVIAKNVTIPSTIEVNGTVLSEESIDLYPEISGRLIYLNMPDGAMVAKGTMLAKINDADLQAQLEQQKVQLLLAIKTEERLKQLLAVNGVNQSDYDAALSQVNTIQANIKVLEAQIDKTIVRASFDGKLGLRLVSLGAYVTPQTHLGSLQQTDKIKIDFTVPESYSSLVEVGNPVSIQTNKTNEKLIAVISAVEPKIDIETRNIKARARLKESNISPGSFVKVLFDKKESGIMVPSQSIIPDASSNQVIVIKKKRAVFTNVETGIRNADGVELLSGVNQGDTIVTNGVLFVRPNAFVSIRRIENKETVRTLAADQTVK